MKNMNFTRLGQKIGRLNVFPIALLAILFTAVLYLIGFSIFTLPFISLIFVFTLKFPVIFNTFFSRIFISIFLAFALSQVAAYIQLFIFPTSGFNTLGAIFFIASALFVFVMKNVSLHKYRSFISFVDIKDIGALVCVALFMIPVFVILTHGGIQNLAELGGLQGVDGVNHYMWITSLDIAEHLDYAPGSYYPKGFHIAIAFFQDSIWLDQTENSWLNNVYTYFGQYVVFGSAMLISLYYVFIAFSRQILNEKKITMYAHLGAAIALSVTVTLFIFFNFFNNGFLSYFYIASTIFLAITCLLSLPLNNRLSSLASDERTYLLFLYLLLILGASASWPLLTPPLLLTGMLFFIDDIKIRFSKILSTATFAVIVAVVFNLLAVYLQFKYSTVDNAESVNLTGGLRIFHIGVLAIGLVVLGVFVYSSKLSVYTKKIIQQIVLPMFVLVIGLALMQYFFVGEVRYYTIKTFLILEMIIFAMTIALVSVTLVQKSKTWYLILTIPVLVIGIFFVVIGLTSNPLEDARNIIRSPTSLEMPAYLTSDSEKVANLGVEGLLVESNSLTLHVSESGKVFTHMQGYYWGDVMSYDASVSGYGALVCSDSVYKILFKQDFSLEAQRALIDKVNECIEFAKDNNSQFYIITDRQSEPQLETIFTQSNVNFRS